MIGKSEGFKSEYCATIVRIGAIVPIEGTDNLATTEIEGRILVVNRHQIMQGDIRIYFSNECEICQKILHDLSMYDDKTLNKDPETKGYVSKTGRVRMIKLKGQVSMGLTIPTQDIERVYSELSGFDWADHVGEDFDMVGEETIVKAYIPKNLKGFKSGTGAAKKRNRLAIDITPSDFCFHYDTEQLQRQMEDFNPDDSVFISPKLHGTSIVIGNLKCDVPKWGGPYAKYFNFLPRFMRRRKSEYRVIYSSRQVVKNNLLNAGNPPDDIWYKAYLKLKDLVSKDETWYCEIIGYDGDTMIQKGYDYGCKPGEFRILVYRINRSGTEVNANEIRNMLPDGVEGIEAPFPLYDGKLKDLYPEIDASSDIDEWRSRVLSAMKNDAEWLGMERNEPLCKMPVPREGIVVRKNDGSCRAWKLKTLKFLGKEAEAVDKGEVNFE